MVNFPAAEAGCRVSPLDDGNLNRLYPGDPRGTPSEMIAHYHEEVILPLADYAVDLHSGGTSLIYPPTLLRGPAHSPEEEAGLATLTEAFDLPYAWVFTGGGGRGSTARTAMGAANRKGVINVMAELGGAGCVTPEVLRQTERGLRRILHALGMLPGYAPDAPRGTRALMHPRIDLCRRVRDRVRAAEVTRRRCRGKRNRGADPPSRDPGLKSRTLSLSPYAGLVLAMRAMAQVRRGDALFQIAADAV
jgi:predicted deacylase